MGIKEYAVLIKKEGLDIVWAVKRFKTTHGIFSGLKKLKNLAKEVVQFVEVIGLVYGEDGAMKRDIAVELIHSEINQKFIPNALERWVLGKVVDSAVKLINDGSGKDWISGLVERIADVKSFYEKLKTLMAE